MFVCPVPLLFFSTMVLILRAPRPAAAAAAAAGEIKRFSTVWRRDKDSHDLSHDDIRVEAFCRNRAASALPLIALPASAVPSCSQIGLAPESFGTITLQQRANASKT
jgi:hypothetical protein